jgi:hypothetical protein
LRGHERMKTTRVWRRSRAIVAFFAYATFSLHVCATERVSSSPAATADNFAPVNRPQAHVESSSRQPVLSAMDGLQRPITQRANSIASQFMDWYFAASRHEKALAFELLLIGCRLGLRIYLRHENSSPTIKSEGNSTATNSLSLNE